MTTTSQDLPAILERHRKWLFSEPGGERADLSRAENVPPLEIARTRILPEGTLIGWKKCQNGVVVKLRVPEDAMRSHAFGRKCRAEFVDVVEVFPAGAAAVSIYDAGKTAYEPGKRVACHKWGEDWQEECAAGIHFYLTRLEAEAHT